MFIFSFFSVLLFNFVTGGGFGLISIIILNIKNIELFFGEY